MASNGPLSFGNRILDSLPRAEAERLHDVLKPITLPLRQVLYRAGEDIGVVYFPVRGLVSIITPLHDGAAVEVGTVGNEGLVGLPALLANSISPHEVIVQGSVQALRAEAASLKSEFERSGAFRHAVLRFAELFIEAVSQTAACNGRHKIEARCARWFLQMSDRSGAEHFPLTHELLATLLGVRRTGVSTIAMSLQRRGAIRYTHGNVQILDRAILKRISCECYFQMRERNDNFLR